MKDKYKVESLERRVSDVEIRVSNMVKRLILTAESVSAWRNRWMKLDDIFIKDCPKCKHPVLAVVTPQRINEVTPQDVLDGIRGWTPAHHQCLTCGSKFTCSEKCACELIEE